MNIFKDAFVVGADPQVAITAFTYDEPGKDTPGLTIKFHITDSNDDVVESAINIGSDALVGVYDVAMVALPIVNCCRDDDSNQVMTELLSKATMTELGPIWDQRELIINRYVLPYVMYAINVTLHDEFPMGKRHDTETEIAYRVQSIALLDYFVDEISEDLFGEECDDDWLSEGGGYDDAVERIFNIFAKMGTYTDLFPAEAIAQSIFDTIDHWCESEEYCENGIPEREISDVVLRTDALCGIRVSMLIPVMDHQFTLAYYSEEN